MEIFVEKQNFDANITYLLDNLSINLKKNRDKTENVLAAKMPFRYCYVFKIKKIDFLKQEISVFRNK